MGNIPRVHYSTWVSPEGHREWERKLPEGQEIAFDELESASSSQDTENSNLAQSPPPLSPHPETIREDNNSSTHSTASNQSQTPRPKPLNTQPPNPNMSSRQPISDKNSSRSKIIVLKPKMISPDNQWPTQITKDKTPTEYSNKSPPKPSKRALSTSSSPEAEDIYTASPGPKKRRISPDSHDTHIESGTTFPRTATATGYTGKLWCGYCDDCFNSMNDYLPSPTEHGFTSIGPCEGCQRKSNTYAELDEPLPSSTSELKPHRTLANDCSTSQAELQYTGPIHNGYCNDCFQSLKGRPPPVKDWCTACKGCHRTFIISSEWRKQIQGSWPAEPESSSSRLCQTGQGSGSTYKSEVDAKGKGREKPDGKYEEEKLISTTTTLDAAIERIKILEQQLELRSALERIAVLEQQMEPYTEIKATRSKGKERETGIEDMQPGSTEKKQEVSLADMLEWNMEGGEEGEAAGATHQGLQGEIGKLQCAWSELDDRWEGHEVWRTKVDTTFETTEKKTNDIENHANQLQSVQNDHVKQLIDLFFWRKTTDTHVETLISTNEDLAEQISALENVAKAQSRQILDLEMGMDRNAKSLTSKTTATKKQISTLENSKNDRAKQITELLDWRKDVDGSIQRLTLKPLEIKNQLSSLEKQMQDEDTKGKEWALQKIERNHQELREENEDQHLRINVLLKWKETMDTKFNDLLARNNELEQGLQVNSSNTQKLEERNLEFQNENETRDAGLDELVKWMQRIEESFGDSVKRNQESADALREQIRDLENRGQKEKSLQGLVDVFDAVQKAMTTSAAPLYEGIVALEEKKEELKRLIGRGEGKMGVEEEKGGTL